VAGVSRGCRRHCWRRWRLSVCSATDKETGQHHLHEQRNRRTQPTGPGPDWCRIGAKRTLRRDHCRRPVAVGAHENRHIISEKILKIFIPTILQNITLVRIIYYIKNCYINIIFYILQGDPPSMLATLYSTIMQLGVCSKSEF